jgi:hypothetical protein
MDDVGAPMARFQQVPHNPTKRLQRHIRAAINDCKEIIPKEDKWKYISLNPTTPRLRGLIKIHKTESPIRPVVNWKNAPAYKLAKMLVDVLQTHTPLPYAFERQELPPNSSTTSQTSHTTTT